MKVIPVGTVDCETQSTEPNASLLSIGVVCSDLLNDKTLSTFYVNIKPESCAEFGLHISASTLAWWEDQGEEAKAILAVDQKTLPEALDLLTAWIKENNIEYVMGNGIRSDNVWIANAYAATKKELPWEYWGDLDLRTLRFIGEHILGEETWHNDFVGDKHNALHDAINEDLYSRKIFSKLIKGCYKIQQKTDKWVESIMKDAMSPNS